MLLYLHILIFEWRWVAASSIKRRRHLQVMILSDCMHSLLEEYCSRHVMSHGLNIPVSVQKVVAHHGQAQIDKIFPSPTFHSQMGYSPSTLCFSDEA